MKPIQFKPLLLRAAEYPSVIPKFPCIVMPKLNGVQAHAWQGKLYTKEGKEIDQRIADYFLKHVCPPSDTCLVGEIWGVGKSLQEIYSLVSPTKLNEVPPSPEGFRFYVFDYYRPNDLGFGEQAGVRMHNLMSNLASEFEGANAVCIRNIIAQSLVDYNTIFKTCVELYNFEGTMAKALNGYYIPSKNPSPLLIKRKNWQDGEFPIHRIEPGLGKASNACGSIMIKLPSGEVSKIGSFEMPFSERERIWAERDLLVGGECKVRYLNLSDGGVPLNGIVIAVAKKI